MDIALYDNLSSGGSKREAFELARTLTSHGHNVDLWTTSQADTTFLPMDTVTRRQYCYTWPVAPRLPARLPGLRGYAEYGQLASHIRRTRAVAHHMARAIDSARYDFVFAHHCHPVQGPPLLRYLHTPSIYYCAEPMRAFYDPVVPRRYKEPQTLIDRWQRRWYAPVHRWSAALVKRADARNVRAATTLLTNSQFTAESIYRAYGRRAFVSYLGVDVARFQPLGLGRDNYVLSVGAVSPLKGYDFLVDALRFIPIARRPRLVIVANAVSASEYAYIRKLARARGVTLELRHNINDAELVTLYNRAQALVYAPVLEPFGFAPLEAMACGTPIVAVAEGGVRESVRDGETGLLTPRDPRRFAAALDVVLTEPETQQRLGVTGICLVHAHWTWDCAYQRFIDLVEDSLRGRASSCV